MTVSKDKEFEYVTSQIIKHIERSVDAFKMFAQLFSAIVGGSIWLSIQGSVHPPKSYAVISDILVGLVTIITIVMVFDDYRAWYRFRKSQSELVPHVPEPTLRSMLTGGVMILCMIAGCILFWVFNPLA